MFVVRTWYRAPVLAGALLGTLVNGPLRAQTFVQLPELSPAHTIGSRITQTVALSKLNRQLFGAVTAKVTLVDGTVSPPVAYEFSSDAIWNRILFGQKDEYIYAFTNDGSSTRRVLGPGGLDVSANRTLFIADQMNGRVLLAHFDASAKTITQVTSVDADPDLGGIVDVAWDGGTSPLVTQNFYTLDGSGAVSYWVWNGSGAPVKQWVYRAYGTADGQFNGPSGLCAGHMAGSGGGSVFTAEFYIADTWNHRVVELRRMANGLSWKHSVTLPDNGVPSDCSVDHFGNVIVADSYNSRLLKYTSSLDLLSQYGTFGVGPQNDNTFAHPGAVHVPFGSKLDAGGQTIWYGEGRVLTAEDWSASSGAREHYLGLELSRTSGPDTVAGLTTFVYRVTDHAYHTVLVKSLNNTIVRRLNLGSSLMPSGNQTIVWDGLKDDGTYAAPGYHYFTLQAVSAYGCAMETWCNQFLTSSTFWFNGRTDCGPPDPAPPVAAGLPPINRQQCLTPQIEESEPVVLVMHQRVFREGRPLGRVMKLAATAPDGATTTSAGSLTDLVRAYGVRGVSFGVPRSATTGVVSIRIYTLAGRPIRVLVNEALEAGYYEVAWDGLDDRGRPATPGVYFAVLTAGSERQTQRLILRQP